MSDTARREYWLYLRKSKGRSGISRQRAVTTAHINRIGGRITREFTDADRTAYQKPGEGRPERPDFDAMLAALASAPGVGIASWHADRLVRNSGDAELIISACAAGGHPVETPRGGCYDLASATGRKRFRGDANDAAYEVDIMSERMVAQKDESRAAGLPLGGHRSFGFSADGLDLCRGRVVMTAAEAERRGLEPEQETETKRGKRVVVVLPYDEAAELDTATRKVTTGTTLYSIARDWNSRGVLTAEGGRWGIAQVRRVLISPRNAGLVVHKGKDVPAAWEAAVDEAVWRQARAILTSPQRLVSPGPERRYLGSGIYRCCCGAPMMVVPLGRKGQRKRPAYRCSTRSQPAPGAPGEKHATRDAAALDAWVELNIIEWLAIPGNIALLAKPAADMKPVEKELAQVRAELDEHAAEAGALRITARQLSIVSAGLMAREKELQARLDAASQPDVIRGLKLTGAALWKALEGDLGRQRALLSMILRVRVLPAPKGRPPGWRPGMSYFHPDCVKITRKI